MEYTLEKVKFSKYKIFLSSGASLKIDEDEVDKIMIGIKNGMPVRVRQGIFNPSFFVAITIDEERKRAWRDNIQTRLIDGEMCSVYPVPENLPDIFESVLDTKKISTPKKCNILV